MKCIRCQHDARYPERSGKRCPKCRGAYAFELRDGDPLSDAAWQKTIDLLGAGGTVRFTRENLRAALARRMRTSRVGPFIAGLVPGVILITLSAILLSEGQAGAALVPLAIYLPILALAVRAARSIPPCPIDGDRFDRLLRQWKEAHGPVAGLISPKSHGHRASAALDEELSRYSFDRAVICDQPETVDLLLGNNFHFENNCAVLTLGGYPEHAAPMVRKMLRQNPRLEVFVLHDATPEGCTTAWRLRHEAGWFDSPEVRIFDVALRPGQAKKMRRLVWSHRAPIFIAEHPALDASERSWLSRHTMHLAALPPEQLIKRLYRAMQHLPELAATGGSTDGVIFFASDASASDGGADSFG
jgi:hypothetical protein